MNKSKLAEVVSGIVVRIAINSIPIFPTTTIKTN